MLPDPLRVVLADSNLLSLLTTQYHTLHPVPDYLIPAQVYEVTASLLNNVEAELGAPKVTATPDSSEIVTSVPVGVESASVGLTRQPEEDPPTHLPWLGHVGCAVKHRSGRTLLILPSQAELNSRPPAGGVKPSSIQHGPDIIEGLGVALFRFKVNAHGWPIMSADGHLSKAEPRAPAAQEEGAQSSPPVLSCLIPSCGEPARGPGGGPTATAT